MSPENPGESDKTLLVWEYPPYPGSSHHINAYAARGGPMSLVGTGLSGFRSPGSCVRGLPVRLID